MLRGVREAEVYDGSAAGMSMTRVPDSYELARDAGARINVC